MSTLPPHTNLWRPFDQGHSVGSVGSEGGIILMDEEHIEGARVTLERGGASAPFSITCGIYGWMVHTIFLADKAAAYRAFEQIKAELTEIVKLIPNDDEPELLTKMNVVAVAIRSFIERCQ